jgi:hypothetical protein
MKHVEYAITARNKFAAYTKEQCDFAIRDIHATLAAQGADITSDYSTKLYVELDAARARQLQLREESRFTRAQLMEIVEQAHAAFGYLESITTLQADREEFSRRRENAWAALCAEK